MAGTGAARRYRSADAAVNRTVHLFSIIVYETLGAELIGYAREHLAYFEAQRLFRGEPWSFTDHDSLVGGSSPA